MNTQNIPIRCMFCDTDNFQEGKCHKCGKDLLPSKGPKQRLKDFVIGFGIFVSISAAGAMMWRDGVSRYYSLGARPHSTESAIGVFIVGVFISLAVGCWVALAKDNDFDKFWRRARRHLSIFPERALLDFSKAVEVTKDVNKRLDILKEKVKLLQELGREQEKQKCLLSYLYMINMKIQAKGDKASASFLLKRAEVHELLGQVKEAVFDYEKIISKRSGATVSAQRILRIAKDRVKELRRTNSNI